MPVFAVINEGVKSDYIDTSRKSPSAKKVVKSVAGYTVGGKVYRAPKAKYIEKIIQGDRYLIKIVPKVSKASSVINAINAVLTPQVYRAPRLRNGKYAPDVKGWQKGLELAGQLVRPTPTNTAFGYGQSGILRFISAINDFLYARNKVDFEPGKISVGMGGLKIKAPGLRLRWATPDFVKTTREKARYEREEAAMAEWNRKEKEKRLEAIRNNERIANIPINVNGVLVSGVARSASPSGTLSNRLANVPIRANGVLISGSSSVNSPASVIGPTRNNIWSAIIDYSSTFDIKILKKLERFKNSIGNSVDRLLNYSKQIATDLNEKLRRGSIDLPDYVEKFSELIRKTQIGSAILGAGGAGNLSEIIIEKVQSAIDKSIYFLNRFIDKISSLESEQEQVAQITDANMNRRLDAGWGTSQEARGDWIGAETNWTAIERRVLGATEHCPDCEEYASWGWVPVGTLPSIGDSVCGEHCHCEVEFAVSPDENDSPIASEVNRNNT